MPKVMPRFGSRVSRLLEREGISQRELARRAGENCSLSTVQSASVGVVPGPEKVLAIALAFGEDPNKLLGAAGWPFRYDPQVIEEAEAESDQRPLRRRLGYAGVCGMWEALLEFAGLSGSGIKRHSMRHWFISEVAAVEGVKVAQELAGHANAATTARYLHAQPLKMRRATESLVGLVTRRELAVEREKRKRVRVAR